MAEESPPPCGGTDTVTGCGEGEDGTGLFPQFESFAHALSYTRRNPCLAQWTAWMEEAPIGTGGKNIAAAQEGILMLVTSLLTRGPGAVPESVLVRGVTTLATACGDVFDPSMDVAEFVDQLGGRDAEVRALAGASLLGLAALAGFHVLAEALVEAGADLDGHDAGSGWAVGPVPVLVAAEGAPVDEAPKMVMWLLDNGANAHARRSSGTTLLQAVVRRWSEVSAASRVSLDDTCSDDGNDGNDGDDGDDGGDETWAEVAGAVAARVSELRYDPVDGRLAYHVALGFMSSEMLVRVFEPLLGSAIVDGSDVDGSDVDGSDVDGSDDSVEVFGWESPAMNGTLPAVFAAARPAVDDATVALFGADVPFGLVGQLGVRSGPGKVTPLMAAASAGQFQMFALLLALDQDAVALVDASSRNAYVRARTAAALDALTRDKEAAAQRIAAVLETTCSRPACPRRTSAQAQFACSGCRSTFYCSALCQAADAQRHVHDCAALGAAMQDLYAKIHANAAACALL